VNDCVVMVLSVTLADGVITYENTQILRCSDLHRRVAFREPRRESLRDHTGQAEF